MVLSLFNCLNKQYRAKEMNPTNVPYSDIEVIFLNVN